MSLVENEEFTQSEEDIVYSQMRHVVWSLNIVVVKDICPPKAAVVLL